MLPKVFKYRRWTSSGNRSYKTISDPVHTYLPPIEGYNPGKLYRNAEDMGKDELLKPFDTEHNRKLTWEHLYGKPVTGKVLYGKNQIGQTDPMPMHQKWLSRKEMNLAPFMNIMM